jgi:lysyl-tRNA synthetase class 1
VGLDDVPILMKEYDDLEDIYFGKVKVDNPAKLIKDKGLYEYINKLRPPEQPGAHMSYQLISQQAAIFPSSEDDRYDKIFNRLVTYNIVKEKTDEIILKIRLASNWADDNMAREETFDIKLTDPQRKIISDLIEVIKPFAKKQSNPDNAKELQSKVFDVARNNSIEPKELFTLLYRMFLNADRGPRIGNYFLDLGIDRAISVLQRYL